MKYLYFKIHVKNKDLKIVHVIRKMADLMLGKLITPKYFDPRILVVNVHIYGKLVSKVIIGVAINIMIHSKMDALSLDFPQPILSSNS